jgi:hypothetical protein
MAFAISTVVAAVGVGIAGYGLYNQVSNQSQAADANAAAARNQAAIAAVQKENVGVQRQQLDLSSSQQKLQNQTQRAVIAQQAQADALRMQASELDATRRRRDEIRKSIVAQSTSLTRATNQGASSPGSTAVAQASADIQGQSNTNILGITQNLGLGRQLFEINKSISNIYLNASTQNDQYVDKSKLLQQEVLGNQERIYDLGGSVSLNYADAASASGNAAIGAGITSIGMGLANNSQTIGRLYNYFGSGSSTYGGASTTSDPTGYGSLY